MNRRALAVLLSVLSVASLAACGGGGSGSSSLSPAVLESGARYFSIDGKQQFLASRNISGRSVDEIGTLLAQAHRDGTRLVRFHVTHLGGMGVTAGGEIDEAWAAGWDQVFDRAEAEGLYVLPVFGVWADWNDGSNGETWHAWELNPLNHANGGPALSPLELYQAGGAGQTAWIGWVGKLVQRWQAHRNVAGWEVFSELELVTRGTLDDATFRSRGIAFVEAAASAIRAADPAHRPVTASLANWGAWTQLYKSSGIDIAQFHIYGPTTELDAAILGIASMMREAGKPILLGESGLDWRPPDGTTHTTDTGGSHATRHAVWAALVAGAMNGRALWWEDGYDILQNNDDAAVEFVTNYPAVESATLAFLDARSMAGMAPLDVTLSGSLVGGAVGDGRTVLGWVRAPGCSFPAWQCFTDLAGETVAVDTALTAWHVTFRQPFTGGAIGDPVALTGDGSQVVVPLPAFRDDVAFELTADP